MPAGANTKREREFKELRSQFRQSGRYKGREEEVAARIVNKQRARFAETREAKEKQRKGNAPDKNLPLAHYEHMTIPEISRKLHKLSASELRKLQRYESAHKNRKGMMALYQRYLNKV